MARTPVETTVPNTELTLAQDKNMGEMIEAGQQASIAQAAVLDAEEALKIVGRIEAAEFLATVAEKMIAESAIVIKQSKQYKGLPYKDEGGNWRQVATFEEFCQYKLGKSRRRVDELVSNYNQLGPDLYEQAEKIGFRQRDYNALKALPADDRLLIAQAIEEEDLNKALDMMQEMAVRHVREKEALLKKTEELAHAIDAKDTVIKTKSAAIDKQAEKLALLENKKRNISPDQALAEARANLQATGLDIKAHVMTSLRKALLELYEHPGNHALYAAGLLAEIGRELNVLRDEYNLPSQISDAIITDPTWAAIEAGQAG